MNLRNTIMNSEEIKHLLQKYFDGDTTLEEEISLKNFFSGGDIPEELNVEKEIFKYFILSAEIPAPSADFEEKIFSAISIEFFPLNLTIPMPPSPNGVEIAAMVSSVNMF